VIKQFLVEKGLKFEFDVTEARGHAVELARTAIQKGYKLIVSVGGDGTINEIVNGLHASGSMKDVELGVISTGTGGDFGKTLGISKNWPQACQQLLNPERLKTDIGLIELDKAGKICKRVFVNFAGMGFDAEIVKATTVRFKKLGGLPAYLMGLSTTLFNYRNKNVTLLLDGTVQRYRACTVVVTNGKYGGGSMFLSPNARIDDGLLDVVIIGDIDKFDLIRSLPRIYRGTHLTHPKVKTARVKTIELSSVEPASIQADGELIGESAAKLTVLPGALTILK